MRVSALFSLNCANTKEVEHTALCGMHYQHLARTTMTLTEYFSTEPRGAKLEMAEHLGITPTWLSLLMSGKKKASPLLCVRIEEATQQLVSKKDLRPDLFS